jgi:hypothetical protein
MALVKDENSYTDVAEADVYFGNKLDVAAWSDATDPIKEQALITATAILDDKDWAGVIANETQFLSFPRNGFYFDPRLGMEVSLASVDALKRIVRATQELAYHLLNNDGLLDDTGRVEDLSLGVIKLSNVRAPDIIPDHVRRIFKPLSLNRGTRSWWRAN